MLFAAGPTASAQGCCGYTTYCWSPSGYSPSFPILEDITASPGEPGGLPGRHLIVELHDAIGLGDAPFIEHVLRRAAEDAKAQLLALHHHVFMPAGGITAFAMLAESHISIHTWPAERYAALDIFMCGVCNPIACLPALATSFLPARIGVLDLYRGLDAEDQAATEIQPTSIDRG